MMSTFALAVYATPTTGYKISYGSVRVPWLRLETLFLNWELIFQDYTYRRRIVTTNDKNFKSRVSTVYGYSRDDFFACLFARAKRTAAENGPAPSGKICGESECVIVRK